MKDGTHSLKKLLEDHRITLKEIRTLRTHSVDVSYLEKNGKFFRFKNLKNQIKFRFFKFPISDNLPVS